jgi:hypothetical protein
MAKRKSKKNNFKKFAKEEVSDLELKEEKIVAEVEEKDSNQTPKEKKTFFKKFAKEEVKSLEKTEEEIVNGVKEGGPKQTSRKLLSKNRPH